MTELVQQIIEKEKTERTGYLDLGRCGLTELPNLSDLDWLGTLIVSDKWWDWEQHKWIESQNKGAPSKLSSLNAISLPLGLTKLMLSSNQISDGVFLEKLTNLSTLALSSNQISDGVFLEKLTNLSTLALSSNQISDWGFLEKLTNLTRLDLSSNQISDGVFLGKLTNLSTLDLSNNKISNGGFLEELTNLSTLALSSNEISNWGFLEKLTNLTTLALSSNQMRDWGFLEKLTNLTTLALSSNQMRDWGFLEKLTNLTTLDLSNNQISDGGFLEELTNLSTLDLSSNEISDGGFLEKMTNLSTLDLSSNYISDGGFLEKLTNLSTLDLSSNYIGDWSFLEKLTNLSTLDLSNNEISDGDFLEKLTNLSTLNLSSNEISDWGFLEKLTNLTTLDLSNNEINDGGFLEKLTNLSTLNLGDNEIKDGGWLEKLPNLSRIDLPNNQLSDLRPLQYFFQEKGLKVVWSELRITNHWEINVKGNPFQTPPVDVVQKGNAAIIEYFRQLEKTGADPLLEAKLILLGDGRAGKTSLANRLLGKALPQEADRTLGVDIVIGEYSFPVAEGRQFKLHIWDFAGQDKYKPLHQFFYTEGAVYVLVADSGNKGTDFDDWLQTAQLFGEGSPLLVALNEFKEGIGYGSFDPEHWQKRFPGLLKEHFLVNLLSEKNVELLKTAIHLYAQSLPHTQVAYPKNWAAIRRELEHRRDENFIPYGEYLNICRQNELPEEGSALILSSILHKIGVCLHYQQNELLQQYIILKNEWATDAVYKILEDNCVAEEKKGFFDWEDLRRIWSDGTYKTMRPQLLELMQQFKMAYPLPNIQEFVAPPLLPQTPPHGWEMPVGEALELFVEYEFLPKALMTQFIVSRHTDIDEGRTLVWCNGVVLRWPDALAEVVKTKSQGRDAFGIQVQGHNRKGLLTAILKTLRDLHSTYKGIKVSEIVPCPCEGCRKGKNKPHFFDFENLKNRLEKGRRTVECDKSLEEVELLQLLGDLLVFDNLQVGEPVVMKDTQTGTSPVKGAPLAFFSYSEQDLGHLNEFQKQLTPLVRSGKIRLWDDRKISPGTERNPEIEQALTSADIVFLLLSSDFLAQDHIWDTEMTEAMRRHEEGSAKVIPIKIRVCSCEDTPFSKLQSLPRNQTAISSAPDRDSIWTEVLDEIKLVLSDWK